MAKRGGAEASEIGGSAEKTGYQRHKERMAERSREASKAEREIGEIAPPIHPELRNACRQDFRLFCENYFPSLFALAWSPDHLRIIAKIERAVLDGGLFAIAMPRGSGKTTTCEVAVIWALIYGHRRFAVLIGAEATSAAKNLRSIRTMLETSDELLADFPEAVLPIRKLEGVHQRRLLHNGKIIRVDISATDLSLPDIAGAAGAEGRVRCVGITGHMRGMVAQRTDGSNMRPDLLLIDDPQTDGSARSHAECNEREAIVQGAALGLAGPGCSIAAVAPVTVIRQDDLADRLLSHDKHPDWQGERCRMVYSWPTTDDAKALWAEYREIRRTSLLAGRGIVDATEFYAANRERMDVGAVVGWPERFVKGELSAIQHAYNLLYRIGPARFAAEFQNEPLPEEQASAGELSVDQIAGKLNRRVRGEVPTACQHVTGMIDVQERALYWLVAAWQDDFTGYVLDYGVFPDQGGTPYYTYAELRKTLGDLLPNESSEAQIHAGLEVLVSQLADRQWIRADGASMRLERLLIDANYKTDTIYGYCAGSKQSAIITPSHGKYVGARSSPFSDYKKKPGDRVGNNWRMPNVQGRRASRYVLFDSNYWKSFIHSRLSTPMGGAGSLSLYGDDPRWHTMLAEHLTAEFRTRTAGRGRECDEWQQKPGRTDNHLLDCAVGSAVAASIQGVSLLGEGVAPAEETRRKASIPEHLRRR